MKEVMRAMKAANAHLHVKQVIQEGRADAVCAASLFHYGYVEEMSALNAKFEEGNIEFLKKELPIPSLGRRGITATSIPELKSFLEQADISTRRPKTFAESPAGHAGEEGKNV